MWKNHIIGFRGGKSAFWVQSVNESTFRPGAQHVSGQNGDRSTSTFSDFTAKAGTELQGKSFIDSNSFTEADLQAFGLYDR